MGGTGCPTGRRSATSQRKGVVARESFRVFGIGKDDDKKIIQRLGFTLLSNHEKLFDRYWWHTFGPPNSLL